MKILMLPSYCYPEQVSSSHLTNDLFEAFEKAGIETEIYAPSPCRGIDSETRNKYKSIKDETRFHCSLTIHRFSMFSEGTNTIQRAIRYVLVNLKQIRLGSKASGIDIIYSASTPPTQGLMCGRVKKALSRKYGRKIPFVYVLQDIFPDSLVNARMTTKGSLLWRIGQKIENYTYRNAEKIITISEDFKRNIMEKGVPENKIVVIPNWVNTENVHPVSRTENILFNRYGLDRDKFYICYSGTIGHSQNTELLLSVAKKIGDRFPDIRFVLIGEGTAKEEIEHTIKAESIKNVVLLPFQDYVDIAHVFSLGDVGLIISKPGVGGSSVPSKTFSIMAAKRPILASFDLDSELCKLLEREYCGIVTDPQDEDAFISGIEKLYHDRELREQYGEHGFNYVTNILNKDKCVNEYILTLDSLVSKVKR